MLWLWELDQKSIEPLQAGGRWLCFPVGAGESGILGHIGSIDKDLDPDRRTHAGQKAVFHLVLRQCLPRAAALPRWGADRRKKPRRRQPAWPGISLAQICRAPPTFPYVGPHSKRGQLPDLTERQKGCHHRHIQGPDVPHGLMF